MSTPLNGSTGAPKYPGVSITTDGSDAVVQMETAASDAAGAYPITPSTQMGEGWAAAMAAGKTNVFGRRLLFFEPEGEHAAAAVTAGMNMMGLRSANFSSGQGIAYMHESLYPAVGKRLTYVLNMACRAMTKHTLNVHAGHDDYHAVDDTGFFQVFAKNVSESADLNLISHRISELALNPGICAQDGFLTSHSIESSTFPERELIPEYLGDPSDIIDSPTPAQRMVFGEKRRRIPELYDLDYPAMLGVVQNQDSYMQGVAAQRPFYFEHIPALTDQAMNEFAALTGRQYERVMGYRLDDAEYVIAGQGSVSENAEAVVDYLREERGLKIGVMNMTMFRPFPSDLVTKALRGKKAVMVMERLDQPLAVEGPLVREIRGAMAMGVEKGRKGNDSAYAGLTAVQPEEVPDFYSACFGMGSRDLQPKHVIAGVDNMLDGGKKLRHFYLGIEFIRKNTRLPKLQIWQEELLDGYPELEQYALDAGDVVDLLPKGTTNIRVHSIGGWGAITMGKNLAVTAAELLDLSMKANPKYGSEKKGQPTTFYASLAPERIRINCELSRVDVVLSPDPNVFRHSNPLQGLARGGTFIIQSELGPQDFWNTLPRLMQQHIRDMDYQVWFVDGFKIAQEESSNEGLRYRMQGTAFMGAFFHAAPMVAEGGLEEEQFFSAMHKQLEKKFGHLGAAVVADNERVIKRGYEELQKLDLSTVEDDGLAGAPIPVIPSTMSNTKAEPGLADPGRFWEQVGHAYRTGQEILADPFAATATVPAATSTMRDMTDVRFEIPKFVPANCTGCAQCWTQCPDTAIPGLVTSVEDVLKKAAKHAGQVHEIKRFNTLVKPLANEARKMMKSGPFHTFGDVLKPAFATVIKKMAPPADRRAELEAEFTAVYPTIDDFPLAKTGAFFDGPEGKKKGEGALLSITINPETCKGCNVCVDVCPDEALITIKQTDEEVELMRRNWEFWNELPETDDKYVKIASLDEGIGVLSSMLLKKENYLSMSGGDGACMGCGEKTSLHLVISATTAMMGSRVEAYVAKLDDMIKQLDDKARSLVTNQVEIDDILADDSSVDIPLNPRRRDTIQRIAAAIKDLKDLRWRYVEGPSGNGRAPLGFANSTGCTSVWASTYPYNPYPFPWVNHLFQDSPSIAIGIFEGQMRKMADGFIGVRRAEKILADQYDAEKDEAEYAIFDYKLFTDEEFHMCPPIFAVGGDGAMMDIGFQNLSRMLASGLPIRTVVLDTQVYSNTGGQACTSGFTGQISDMAMFGKGQAGKVEIRKELSLLAMAHRNVFVLQSSQATASHLLGGVLRGLQSKHPAIFILHSACPPEHGIADDAATRSSRMALESRAFPTLEYDPDRGDTFADCLELDGNPAMEDTWPSYKMKYVDADGNDAEMEQPMTIADWAASEGRFKKHFRPASESDDLVPFAEFVAMSEDDREGKVPYINVLDGKNMLRKMQASHPIVQLAEDRLRLWSQLKEMAGEQVTGSARDNVTADLEDEFDQKVAALKAEHDAKVLELRTVFPQVVARRMAEGLLRSSGDKTVQEILTQAENVEPLEPLSFDADAMFGEGGGAPVAAPVAAAPAAEAPAAAPAAAPVAVAVEEDDDDDTGMDPYIDTERCTSCNECTNLNNRLFVYNDQKLAEIGDPKAGTFQQLVKAAEACPVEIIHPGTPLNPKEKDLAKWIKRAEPFN
ncbi:MAG: pyruvate ferredoxin oxidoreductase [Planctomycetes bacterium]|nr:pyruvate ferredoxin oxidoreductase [Planctomycetota bacterium]MCP4770220.1 pyruvate ferredoxin oxidoreductase [Planctomycetota bacterium]MCP4860632.1 pyruvate ferredoxin oxidoreductase [Planctomycetota bacterium]